MNLLPYPEYKDSDVEWIGDIPKHWEVRRLKFLCHNLNEQTSEKQPGEVYIALEHVESWTGRISLPDGEITFDSQVKRFQPGDVLFGKLRPYLAKVTQPQTAGVCVGEFLVLRATENVSADFLEQKLRSKRIIDLINSSTFGAKMPRADWTFIGNLKFAYPSAEEQRTISRFLKNKTSQVNKFIRNKRRLIALLKEQKQNIINQAVTRGLDPKIKLKPSGVEWLGDIPEHWEVRRLKFLCHNLNEQTSEKQPGETYIALEHVESWTGRISLPDGEITFDSQVKRFQPGDVLFGKLRPYLAKVTQPQTAGVCVGEFLVLRATENVSADFLEQKLRSKRIIDLINSSTFGAKMPRADWTFIGNLKFAYPPAEEQREILEHIKKRSVAIDHAITRAEREIELMREYRTRLISDVVTGKVDVRGIEVPEVAEDELLPLEEDDAATAEMMDSEEDMDEND